MVDDSQPTPDTQPRAAKPTAAEVKLAYEYFGILPGTKLEDMLGPICASPISVRKLVRKGLHMPEETMEHSDLGRQRLFFFASGVIGGRAMRLMSGRGAGGYGSGRHPHGGGVISEVG